MKNVLENGDVVFVCGDVRYGKNFYRTVCNGIIQSVGDKTSLVTLDEIDGDENATVQVLNQYIRKLNRSEENKTLKEASVSELLKELRSRDGIIVVSCCINNDTVTVLKDLHSFPTEEQMQKVRDAINESDALEIIMDGMECLTDIISTNCDSEDSNS